MSTRKVLLEDGVSYLILEDGVNFLLLEGAAQASDDVILRFGPGVDTVTGSGLVAPTFTPSTPPAGGAVFSPWYYMMMQEWFASA